MDRRGLKIAIPTTVMLIILTVLIITLTTASFSPKNGKISYISSSALRDFFKYLAIHVIIDYVFLIV